MCFSAFTTLVLRRPAPTATEQQPHLDSSPSAGKPSTLKSEANLNVSIHILFKKSLGKVSVMYCVSLGVFSKYWTLKMFLKGLQPDPLYQKSSPGLCVKAFSEKHAFPGPRGLSCTGLPVPDTVEQVTRNSSKTLPRSKTLPVSDLSSEGGI